jgi:putative transposase
MKNSNIHICRTLNDFAFETGQFFRNGATVFRIVETRGAYFTVEHATSLERRCVPYAELNNGFLSGKIVPCAEAEISRALSGDGFIEDDYPAVIKGAISLLSDSAKTAGLKIIKYLQALRGIGYSSLRPTPLLALDYTRLTEKFKDAKPPKLSTLYKWSLIVDRTGGDLRAAFPNYVSRGGRGKNRIQPEVESLLQKIFESLQGNAKARIKFSWIADDLFRQMIEQYGREKAVILMPSVSTIVRETKKTIGSYGICVRNEGKKAANKKFREWHPRDRATEPLEVVEFDDKDTGVFGIDEVTGLPFGRIYLTAGLDQHSAVPMGLSISEQPRNTWSAINALVNCVLPKDLTLPEWSGVKGDIPYMGKMGIALFDNALYNHAAALEAAAIEIANLIIAWAKPYAPTEKSGIEGFNGRMISDFLVTLPGFSGPKKSRDMVSEGMRTANLSVAVFKKLFNEWAYNVYCNTPGARGLTPRQTWEMGMLGRKPRLPPDINLIRLSAMPTRTIRLRPEQILFIGLNYQNERLGVLRRFLGHNAEVKFKHDLKRLEKILVLDPKHNEWFEVPSVNPEYTTGLSLYQHKLIRKKARENGVHNPSSPQYMQYRAELATMVEQLRWSKKLTERKSANRTGGIESVAPTLQSQSQVVIMTDLEAKVNQLEAVEMEVGDEGWEFPALI